MKRFIFLSGLLLSVVIFSPGVSWSETHLSDKVTLDGVLEVEAGVVDDMGEETSDVTLATVEVGLNAKISGNVEGNLVLLYEEDDTEEFTVDEGTITITSPYGLSVTAGKMYIPFGMFNSHFISDPQTLELGETNQSAILIGYANDMFEISVGAFNGDFDDVSVGDNVDKDDKVDDYVASLTVTPAEGISFGASYISDIADTDAEIGGGFYNISATDPETYTEVYDDIVAGYSAFISASVGPVTLEAEYLAAADKFDKADIAAEDQPSTFNVELAYAISEAAEIALKYEGANDLEIEKLYGIAYSRELYENTSFALEYLSGTYDEDRIDDPNEDELTAITVQLAIEF